MSSQLQKAIELNDLATLEGVAYVLKVTEIINSKKDGIKYRLEDHRGVEYLSKMDLVSIFLDDTTHFEILSLANKLGWTFKDSNRSETVYSPPKCLGFTNNVVLRIPCNSEIKDYQEAIERAVKFLELTYETPFKQLFFEIMKFEK